ncbi:ectoine synthase [Salinisphaera sp. SPP-AMP-43]|uniref:ectoine synthase n=1 Tax=Salinisphaera sp. SPP-AMP-43 TaxID=3121288 RepID=UPI003C6E4CD8
MLVRQPNQNTQDGDIVVENEGWASRRLVLARDGLDYSLHDTMMHAGSTTVLDYPHHLESAYCIAGEGELEDLTTGERHLLGPGTVYSMGHGDRIRLQAHTDVRLICALTPALTGREQLSEGGGYPLAPEARPALRKKNLFVVNLNEFNLGRLQSIRNAENYNFLKLLDGTDVLEQTHYDIDRILAKARAQLQQYPGQVDGLIHYIDFPVSTTVPILCREFGLPSASLEAVLKCEHKFWSRYEQRQCIADHIPQFAAFDPFDDQALDKLGLDFPFWVKPIKSFSSYLGFRINNRDDWDHAIAEIRAHIGRFEGPFDKLLERVRMPEEVASIGGGDCIAESIIGGRMCTQEGFVHKGRLRVYGTVDSMREPNGSSFASYQYPSRLPARVRKRMTEIVETFMAHIGYDNAPFNVEFFWDANTDQIWLLEVNPRISESHADLFRKVDGASHHEIATDLSLGARPRLPYRDGEFAHAGKFFIRAYRDALVKAVPGPEALAEVARHLPDTIVRIMPRPGQRLSELMDQDSYSYTLAIMWIGAASPAKLQRNFERAVELLEFDLEPV